MALPKALASALRFPTFVFGVLCLQFNLALLVPTYRVKWLNFKTKRNDVLALLVLKLACISSIACLIYR
jgi:hypothetical protein